MKTLKILLSLVLASLMAFGSFGGAIAQPAAQKDAQPAVQQEVLPAEKSAEPEDVSAREITEPVIFDREEEGDVWYDQLWQVSLKNAAAPDDALRKVEVTTVNNEWVVTRDPETARAVAGASIASANGTYTRTLSFTLEDALVMYAYVGWSGYIVNENGESFTVRCTDMNTGVSWYPYFNTSRIQNDEWSGYSFLPYTNSTGYANTDATDLKIDFIYTYTVGSKGGDAYPRCLVKDLQYVDRNELDQSINAPQSDLKFTEISSNGRFPALGVGCGYDSASDCAFVYLTGADGEDMYMGVTTTVAAEAGDVISFDYISSLNYMAGANFYFGLGGDMDEMQTLYSGEYEEGEGSEWNDWASWSYTIPTAGVYDFIWVLETWDSYDSYVMVDNVKVTPRMSRERILNWVNEDALNTYIDGNDTPWFPTLHDGYIWMRSGNITHNQTSTMISEGNILKAGDEVYFGINISCEKNYDKLTIYMKNTADPDSEEVVLHTFTGSVTGAAIWSSTIPKDGIYTFRFVYSKDSSVSSGDDCAYLSFVYIPRLDKTSAAAFDDYTYDRIGVWDYYPENRYRFRPAYFNGDVILASDNQGVPNSIASMFVDVHLEIGECFGFEYIKDAETNYDNLYVEVNGVTDAEIKTLTTSWDHYEYLATETGDYRFEIYFRKDSTVNKGTDTVYIRDMYVWPDELNAAVLDEDYYSVGTEIVHRSTDYSGQFETLHTGDRFIAYFYPDEFGQAAFYTWQYQNAYEYCKFDYRILGYGAITFYVNGEIEQIFNYEDGEWNTYYYRIPASGNYRFEIVADAGGDAAVCIDKFSTCYLTCDLQEAIAIDYELYDEIELDYEYCDGFGGIYDPLEPHGHTTYAHCAYEAGDEGVLAWDQYLCAGDTLYIVFCFADEDGVPNGSSFTLFLYGEEQGAYYDDELRLNTWYMIRMPVYHNGEYFFELYYSSAAQDGGDAFLVDSVYIDPIGYTIDEALNVEGGNIDFSEPDTDGCFYPEVSDDRVYAAPGERRSPYFEWENIDMLWNFESEDELDDWIMIDADGDGFGWGYFDTSSTNVCYDAEFGTGVLSSESYTYSGSPLHLDPDNWALTPEIEVPEDNGYINISFVFAGCNDTWYAEHFGVYVGTGTDISAYKLLFDYTIDTQGWSSIAFDLNDYVGQTVRIAFRHYDSYDVYRLMIDHLHIWSRTVIYSQVSFELDVTEGDIISFDLICPFTDPELASGVYLELSSDSENFDSEYYIASDIWEENGPYDWGTYEYVCRETGHFTFTFYEMKTYDSEGYNLLCIYIDNVQLIKNTVVLPGDVDLDGRVTFSDVSALYMYMLGLTELSPEALANADFNGDGQINYVDITDLNMYLLSNG